MIWILKGKTMTKLAVENWILLSGENEPQTTKYRGQKNSHKTQNVRWQLERICLGCIEWIWSLPDRNRHMCFVFHFKLLFRLCKLNVCVSVCVCTQLCPTFCDRIDYSPTGSSVHGIFPTRILSGLPLPPPGDLSDPGIKSESLALAGRFFTTEPQNLSRLWEEENN